LTTLFLLTGYVSPRTTGQTFIVAKCDDKVVGYIMCRTEWGLSELQRFKVVKKGHIVSIAVMPEHRLKNVATALIHTVLKTMSSHNCNETFLEVRASNSKAIALYRKLGYRIIKRASGYYCDGEDAIVMGRILPIRPEEVAPVKGILDCSQGERS